MQWKGNDVTLFSVTYPDVFGSDLLLQVTAQQWPKRKSVWRTWVHSMEGAEWLKGHPWRTMNRAAVMVRKTGWHVAWKYRRHWYSQGQISNEIKRASAEANYLDPDKRAA